MDNIYDSFNDWLENREKFGKDTLKSLKKTGSRGWYAPEGTNGKETSVLDPVTIRKRYPIKDMQDAYLDVIKEKKEAYTVASARYQAGHIKASERAFRLRHTTPVRLMAHGTNELLQLSNGLYKKTLIDAATEYITRGKAQERVKES